MHTSLTKKETAAAQHTLERLLKEANEYEGQDSIFEVSSALYMQTVIPRKLPSDTDASYAQKLEDFIERQPTAEVYQENVTRAKRYYAHALNCIAKHKDFLKGDHYRNIAATYGGAYQITPSGRSPTANPSSDTALEDATHAQEEPQVPDIKAVYEQWRMLRRSLAGIKRNLERAAKGDPVALAKERLDALPKTALISTKSLESTEFYLKGRLASAAGALRRLGELQQGFECVALFNTVPLSAVTLPNEEIMTLRGLVHERKLTLPHLLEELESAKKSHRALADFLDRRTTQASMQQALIPGVDFNKLAEQATGLLGQLAERIDILEQMVEETSDADIEYAIAQAGPVMEAVGRKGIFAGDQNVTISTDEQGTFAFKFSKKEAGVVYDVKKPRLKKAIKAADTTDNSDVIEDSAPIKPNYFTYLSKVLFPKNGTMLGHALRLLAFIVCALVSIPLSLYAHYKSKPALPESPPTPVTEEVDLSAAQYTEAEHLLSTLYSRNTSPAPVEVGSEARAATPSKRLNS